ncbi:Membrane protein involved in the export of O-antigen and teichoic acid [Mesorhizobium sp. NFR06]|nr:Membrane protein involved in the export of O-antigen and teichoic acid [Mesorhizobium sp. NFR06]
MYRTIFILLFSFREKYEFGISNKLTRLMPPESIIWRVRIWQYITRLSRCWKQARKSTDIAIFDQGFVQAIGSLAMFNGAADDTLIAQALHFVPQADFVVRMVVPRDVVETRLRARMMCEPAAERLFEVDVADNMNFFRVFDNIGDVLSRAHQNIVLVQTIDQRSTFSGLCRVEEEILARLSQIEAPVGRRRNALPTMRGPRKYESMNDRSDGNPLQQQAADRVADIAPLAAAIGSTAGTASIAMPAQRYDVGRRLIHASVFALLVYIGGAGLTSMAQLGIARLVGATSYGIYSYALAWSSVLASLSMLGFNVSLLRFVPAYKAAGRLDLARGLITFALWRSLLAATLAGLAGAGLVVFLPSKHLYQEFQATMLLGMVAVPLITAYALGATLVRAFGGVVSALLPERIARDGLLLILLGGAAFSGWWTLDASFAMMAVVASSAVTVGLVLVTATKLSPAGLRDTQATYTGRQWLSAVPPTMLITGLDVFISRTGVVLLGWTGQVREAGIFALGLNVALLVGLSSAAVSTIFSPTAADLHARKDHEALQRLFSRAAVLSFSGAVAMAVPLLLVTEPLLHWFGEDFVAGALIARILITGYVCTALCGPQLNLLTMTGHEWAAATMMVAGAVANIVACAVGMALGGMIGAAVGVVLALVVWNSAMAIYIRKRLNILPGLIFAAEAIRSGQLRVWRG